MEHIITFKLHTPGQGSNKGKTLHFAECSCRNGSPYCRIQEGTYRWVVAHLLSEGLMKSENPADAGV